MAFVLVSLNKVQCLFGQGLIGRIAESRRPLNPEQVPAERDQALQLLEQTRNRLLDEGLAASRPDVGIMIEVPAAVYQVEAPSRRVDFLSDGTNGLAQFLPPTDRDDRQAPARPDPVHPAWLQARKQIADSAHHAGKPVAVCGGIAGDPAMALVLLGIGFNGLCISPAVPLNGKWTVRTVTTATMRAKADEVLRRESPDGIQRLLDVIRRDMGAADLATGATRDHAADARGMPAVGMLG